MIEHRPYIFASTMLAGRVALVTGGSRGIGRAVCIALAQAGADVAVGFHDHAEAAQEVCQAAAEFGRTALPVQADIAEGEQVYGLIDHVAESLGPLDILVNCAGVWPTAQIWEMDDRQWRHTMAVNLDATYYACKAASRIMMERRRGSIVNFSSIAAVRGARTGHADYAASKGGVSALTKSLAHELGPFQITVNAVAPGMIRTLMTEEALDDREGSYLSQIPLERVGGSEEVAGLVVFLVSPAASYITGQIIHVNGGMLMP